MVGFHLVGIEGLFTLVADAFLALIKGVFLAVRKGSQIQVFFIARQQLSIDTFFVDHIVNGHQPADNVCHGVHSS